MSSCHRKRGMEARDFSRVRLHTVPEEPEIIENLDMYIV